jgi:Acyl-coenzyme A:6-aminopenicillanic acid acyl-transferase
MTDDAKLKNRLALWTLSIGLCLLMAGCWLSSNFGLHVDMEKMGSQQPFIVSDHYGKSQRGTINDIPVLVLRGSYAEMGEAQGMLAGKDIIQLLDNTLIPFVNKYQPGAWDSKILPAASSFVFPADYEEELAGMMRGIVKKYPNIRDRMLFSIKREIRAGDLHALNCIVDLMSSENGCSSFSAWGSLTENGEAIFGRNLDERYIPGNNPFMVLAREPSEPNRMATLDIASPGFIGAITAMNADGLTVIAHDTNGFQASPEKKWEPRAIVLRNAIESARANDSAEGIARLFMNRSVRLGSNTHVVMPLNRGQKGTSPFVVEWDGNSRDNGVAVRLEDPAIVPDAIVCTNHYLKRRPEKANTLKSSERRMQLMIDTLQGCRAAHKLINVERALEIMNSVAQRGDWVTYLTVIAIPKEKKIFFAITPGKGVPAPYGKWTELTWNEVFGGL